MASPETKDTTKPRDTIVFSTDVEVNGLYGEHLAVGVSVLNQLGDELHSLALRCDETKIPGLVLTEFVKTNVIPALEDMPINCDSPADLRA
jgi:hypothetical protein